MEIHVSLECLDNRHKCSCATGLVVFLAVEEQRVSSVNAEEQGERFQDARHLLSSRDSERLDWSSLPDGATGHSKDMGPTCEQ